ncbi:hypothetical protein U1Q18_036370 [Sarracenia purpurea var. burkii]
MCAARDDIGSRNQRRTTKGFDNSNLEDSDSSISANESNGVLRTQSGPPLTQNLNRGMAEQGLSQVSDKQAGEPITNDDTVMESIRRCQAQISASKFSIKSQQSTNQNCIDDFGEKGVNLGIRWENFKFQNPRSISGKFYMGKLSKSQYRDSHSADSKLSQRGNTSYGKMAGQDFHSQQKISHGP